MGRKAQKWNFKTEEYEPYELPDGVVLSWCPMDKVITCAECGKKMLYGDGYTSQKIHTVSGMGYMVCKRCYDKEREERKEYQEIWYK